MTQPGRRGSITAEEAIRQREERLRIDPEYRAQFEAVEAERKARADALYAAERPVVGDLLAVGVEVDSVWDLVNTAEPYPDALPVLMEHLERGGYPSWVMQSIARALAVKPSVMFWERLKVCWLGASDPGEAEGVAVALAACATKAQLDDLIELVLMEDRGDTRILFLRPILRLGGERGFRLVETLQEHPVLGKEASYRVKRRRKK